MDNVLSQSETNLPLVTSDDKDFVDDNFRVPITLLICIHLRISCTNKQTTLTEYVSKNWQ